MYINVYAKRKTTTKTLVYFYIGGIGTLHHTHLYIVQFRLTLYENIKCIKVKGTAKKKNKQMYVVQVHCAEATTTKKH